MTGVEPQLTWGINPEHAIGISERIPDPDQAPASKRDTYRQAIEYSRLTPGEPILGTPIDEVFIGSCVESRIMVVGKNYATGSSRVTGVTRPLTAWGVRVYIGESFGPIFLTNAVQYGVLTIELPGRR